MSDTGVHLTVDTTAKLPEEVILFLFVALCPHWIAGSYYVCATEVSYLIFPVLAPRVIPNDILKEVKREFSSIKMV